MNKLFYDYCHCTGAGCGKKEQCLRHTDIPPDDARYPICAALCVDEARVYFIKNSNEKTT